MRDLTELKELLNPEGIVDGRILAAQTTFYEYCKLMNPKFYRDDRPYQRDLCDTLQGIFEGRLINPKTGEAYRNLMINLPPRHGKSYTLTLFVQWCMGRRNETRVISVSYNDILAGRFARNVRDGIEADKLDSKVPIFHDVFPSTRVKQGDAAAQLWSLEGQFFNYLATGFGGTITGIGCSMGIIDDPIKNDQEAFNDRVLDEQLRRLYPDWVERYRVAGAKCAEELLAVAERFQNQLERLMPEEGNYEADPVIADRVKKGAEYFREHTMSIFGKFLEEAIPEIDNKEVRKLVEQNMERFRGEVNLKLETLKVIGNGFSVKDYLRAKAKALIDAPKVKIKAKRAGAEKVEISPDILHSKLYETLRAWRNKEAERLKLPVYTVLQQKALLGISNTLPTNSKELLAVPGVGKKIVERYGAVLLDMVDEFRFQQK